MDDTIKYCWCCDFVESYYRGKNRKRHCLKMAYCEHPKAEKNSKGEPRQLIAIYRDFITDKIKTHPRWCPLLKEQGREK